MFPPDETWTLPSYIRTALVTHPKDSLTKMRPLTFTFMGEGMRLVRFLRFIDVHKTGT